MVNAVTNTITDFWCCWTLFFIKIYHKLFSKKSWLCSWKPAREIFVKFLYVRYLFSVSSAIMKEHGGNTKKKCARLIFIGGEKSGGTFKKSGNFWNVVQKGGLSLPPSLQMEVLCQLDDIQYMYIYRERQREIFAVTEKVLTFKWQNRKFFRLSSFSVSNYSGSNSSSSNHC